MRSKQRASGSKKSTKDVNPTEQMPGENERKLAEKERQTSEERLRLALEAARMGTWDWDLLTGKVIWSDALEPLFGLAPGAFSGTFNAFMECLHLEDRERVREAVAQAIAKGTEYNLEFRIVWPDESVHWIKANGRVFYDETGQAVRMIGVGMDFTEHQMTEADLREQTEAIETVNRIGQLLSAELDLQKLVQAVTDAATIITGAQFGAFFYNVTEENGEGYALFSISGVPQEAFAQLPMPRITKLFSSTFRGEQVIRLNDVTKDPRYGQSAPYFGLPPNHLPVASYLAVPVISRSGEVLGGLFFGHSQPGMFTESDERIVVGLAAQTAVAMDNARLFESIQRERAEAEAANRAKDEFLATVSHELRTPLTSILGWARLLRTGRLDAAATARAIEAIERNAKAQAQLIEDLLDISRIITGKLRVDVRPVELAPVIEAAVDAVRPAAEAKVIGLQARLDPTVGPVSGDPDRLQQVVWNLLSNAVKFTPNGGQVQVRLERINSQAQIRVSDTGQGISAEFLPHVFERFRQADSTITRQYGGLGLGLAIVRHLVELHGGTVHVESPGEGQGSTFTVRLPLASIRMRTSAPARSEARIENLPALNGLRVLVVDDEVDTRDFLAALLLEYGAEAATAASSAEALDRLAQFKPDVLVSDIGMPDEDGYTLIRKVRALDPEQGGRIPAVALTAYARSEDRRLAISAGYHMHIPKPIEPAELITIIASLAKQSGKSLGIAAKNQK